MRMIFGRPYFRAEHDNLRQLICEGDLRVEQFVWVDELYDTLLNFPVNISTSFESISLSGDACKIPLVW